jgi:rSAM/selenodomain-associated transferase 2
VSELGISVIIPTLEEQARIQEILDQTRYERVERIVVDAGSSDGTAAAAREAGAEAVLSVGSSLGSSLRSSGGRARQLAAGAAAASHPILLFLHADTRLPQDWPDAVRSALADPQVSGGAFSLRFLEQTPGLRWVGCGANLRAKYFGLAYGDQALFLRREALDAIGGVPDVPLFEDIDLVRALRAQGRFVVLPESVETSGRRYERNGVLRTVLQHQLALAAYFLGVDRDRVAAWYRAKPSR